jgi:hypothetical protein
VIEPQKGRGQPTDFKFVRDIARAEYAGGEADKSCQRDKIDVEIIDDEQIGADALVKQ